MSGIEVYGKWGDPRKQAAQSRLAAQTRLASWAETRQRAKEGMAMKAAGAPDDHIHGMTASEVARMKDRFEHFIPNMATYAPSSRAHEFFDRMLPPGANLDPNAGAGYAQSIAYHKSLRGANKQAYGMTRQAQGGFAGNLPFGGMLSGGGGVGGGSFSTTQRPYQPEFESPDRQNYPVHRNLANIYWRVFYKLDPIIGTCLDLFSEMPFSDFQLTGEGVDGEIKEALEEMCEETQLRAYLPFMVREFFVIGEVAPHLFFDDDRGIWTHIALHNPDQLEIIHSPFIKMDPVIEFKPEDRLRQILTSNNPQLRQVRESMPEEILAALISGQNIPLSPVNCTFIPRKLHPYDVRGTSIISRMWRILMYEDSIFNASIAIARRAAAPLKVAKLGDRQTGWIPDPSQERRLLELLVQAEIDPAAWLVYHYGIEFDLVGSQERAWKIEQTSEFIERTKLLAMGISKAFLHGEVTYASAASGLSIFLQRLKALREYFETMWIYPKFFRQVSEMNGWVKPTQAELEHRVRTKRSRREIAEGRRYIMPKIEWDRPLDPSIDSAMISAMTGLSGLGVKFSKTTLASLANRDYETELEQALKETKMEQDLLAKHPELQMALAPPSEEGAPGGGGGGVAPGIPPEAMGMEEGAPPPPAGGEGGEPPAAAAGNNAPHGGTEPQKPKPIWNDEDRYGAWSKVEAADLARVLAGDLPDEDPWTRMVEEWTDAARHDRHAIAVLRAWKDGDAREVWELVEEWMLAGGYPPKDVRDLEAILKHEGILKESTEVEKSATMEKLLEMTDDLGSDRLFTGAPNKRSR
jgi:hypothetical protein